MIAHERDPSGQSGVSRAELARCLGVTRQRVDAILAADQPTVNLRAGQIPSLPPRARRAVLSALNCVSKRLDGAKDFDAMHRRLGSLYGRYSDALERAMANDGVIDEREAAELRAALAAIAGEAGGGAAHGGSEP